MSIEVRVGDPEDIVAAYEDADIRGGILCASSLGRLVPDLDLARIQRSLDADDWEPTLVMGAFQEVDTLPSAALSRLVEVLRRRGLVDVAVALASLRMFVVGDTRGIDALGPARVVSRARLREAVELVAREVGYHALGARSADAYAIGDVPFALEVLRHSLDRASGRRWIHVAG